MPLITYSTNHKYDRKMLPLEIEDIFNQLLESYHSQFKGYAIIRPLSGVAQKHGDYVCLSVLEVCEELRKYNPRLFDNVRPRQIAKKIMSKFKDLHLTMIKNFVLHDAGFITFKLDGYWMAKRIEKMLFDGINTWAPIYNVKRRAVLVFPTHTIDSGINADIFRAHYIKDTLVNLLLYSGDDVCSGFYDDSSLVKAHSHFVEKQGVIVSGRDQIPLFVVKGQLPSNDVYTDLATLWYGANTQKADLIVYVNPQRQGAYIRQCFIAATNEDWLPCDPKPTLISYGYRTLSSEQEQHLASLWNKYRTHSEAASLVKLGKASGYTSEASFFECALKFTCLKSHRLAECTFNIEEMLDDKGNTFVNLLKKQALIRSLIKNSPGRNLFTLKKALAGKERELGLHLMHFTQAIDNASNALRPDIVCQYLGVLSELFTRYYCEVRPDDTNKLGLCKATEVVMNKCFHLLGITPGPSSAFLGFLLSVERPVIKARAANYHITPPSETDDRFEYPNSRFEMFSMNVNVAHLNFDRGYLFGNILVSDTYGARANGWMKVDEKDCCHVSYFHHEWHNTVHIFNGSFIPFGNPSCLHSVPFSSSIDVEVLVHVTSEKNDQCYLLCNCKSVIKLSKFLDGGSNTKCGTLKFNGKDGLINIDYILLKEAVDTIMELTFKSKELVRVDGYIMAYYGDDVVKDCDNILGQYKAQIFRADPSKLIGSEKPKQLSLHRSTLAVPANGCLKIEAFLMDVDSKEVIVNRTEKFREGESLDGFSNFNMKGEKCSFDLRVRWIGADK